MVAACTQQMAALLNPPEPADTLACEGGAADIVSNNADRDDGADDALDAAERGCARTALAPLADHQTRERETAAKPAACRTPIAASPISSSGSPAHEVRATRTWCPLLHPCGQASTVPGAAHILHQCALYMNQCSKEQCRVPIMPALHSGPRYQGR